MNDRAAAGPSLAQLTWAEMAGAVGAGAFVPDELGLGGAAAGFDTSRAVHAAAAGIVDTAIAAVGQRRRVRPNRPDDVPLDPAVFDQQTLSDLLDFLRHSRRGLLTAAEIVEEAAMWHHIVDAAWPEEATDHEAVVVAIELLAAVPAPAAAPSPRRPVEPANDIERAVAAVAADERARPRLWRALYEGDVVLPVVAYELVRPEGANFQFLSVPLGDTPVVLGFGIEERFDALLPEGMQFSRVLAPGRDLSKFWPAGHWLMINAGYEPHAALSPWEIAGLPDGGRAELPHTRAVDIDDPGDDDRTDQLVAIVAGLAGEGAVAQVRWARLRGRAREAAGREHARWQDVLVVTAPTPTPEAETASVQAVSAALPPGTFPRMLVIGRQAAMAHPFIEAVVEVARPLVEGSVEAGEG